MKKEKCFSRGLGLAAQQFEKEEWFITSSFRSEEEKGRKAQEAVVQNMTLMRTRDD